MKTIANALIFSLFISLPLAAQPPGWDAFVSGDFEKARSAGQKDGSAEGLAHACRAGLILAGFKEKGTKAIQSLHMAIRNCNAALQLQPDHFFAKMSLAIGLSYEGRRLKRPSYPLRAKAYLQELIVQEPMNPLGHGALAAWHSEVSAAGFIARIALGARRSKAEKSFKLARIREGTDYALRFEYVKFLARGNKKMRLLALAEAQSLIQESKLSAFDHILKKHCEILAAALEKNSKRAIKTALKQASAFQNASSEREVARYPLEQLVRLTAEQGTGK